MLSIHSLTARGSDHDLPFSYKSVITTAHEQNIICNADLHRITHEQTIICRQLFAGHVVGFQPMKMGKKIHRIIVSTVQRRNCRLTNGRLYPVLSFLCY